MAERGKDFGAFELHEKIGSGGMASVYAGTQKSLDRKVVLKILYPHLAEDTQLVARFEREARAAAAMRHPNIVQVIDCGRHEDVVYIAMEFVDGMDLKKWLEQYGPPPLEVTLLLLRDLFSGLEHAHLHRIVHRDIKPANIMFTPDGQLKIMDFGLARKGEDASAMTLVGSVLGTPAYMSPEQAAGEAVDSRSDIFSAGVLAYELLGGQRPFQGDSYSSVLRAVLTVEPPPLGSLNPLVPDEVVQIVHKMLQKDRTRRYANTGQLRAELELLIDQLGMSRSSNLLREFAADPRGVNATLRKKRFARHLDQGIYFENMGLGRIDDALVEFRRALHLDPENKVARDHLKKLEKDRERGHDAGGIEPAGASAPPKDADATLIIPTGGAPVTPAEAPSAAAPGVTGTPSRPALVPPATTQPTLLLERGRRLAPDSRARPRAQVTRSLVVAVAALAVVVSALVLMGRKTSAPDTPAGGSPASRSATAPASIPVPAPGPATARASLEVRTDPSGARGQDSLALVPPPPPPPGPTPMGTLVVRVSPYATYFVDHQVQGQPNTMTARIPLKPGVYTVMAVHPNFEPKVWSGVRIQPGGTVRLTHDFLNPGGGSLKVTSRGGWANVYLDGKPTGKTTPTLITNLEPGTYVVSLVREGFVVVDRAQAAVVKADGTTAVEFTIRPE